MATNNATGIFIGDINQTIFGYSGAFMGYGFKRLIQSDKFSKFNLIYNNRSSNNVILDYVHLHNLKYGIDIIPTKNIVFNYDRNVEFDNIFKIIKNNDAILCHTNKDVYKIAVTAISNGFYVYVKNKKF